MTPRSFLMNSSIQVSLINLLVSIESKLWVIFIYSLAIRLECFTHGDISHKTKICDNGKEPTAMYAQARLNNGLAGRFISQLEMDNVFMNYLCSF